MNRIEGILVAAIVLSSFIGGVFAAPRLFLSTQVFSQGVSFALATQDLTCPLGQFGEPITITLRFWSFKVDLARRDVGSTLITFKLPFDGSLFKSSDLALNLLTDFACAGAPIISLSDHSPDLQTWRPIESGDYTVLTLFPPNANRPLQGVETWTVTSIIRGW